MSVTVYSWLDEWLRRRGMTVSGLNRRIELRSGQLSTLSSVRRSR